MEDKDKRVFTVTKEDGKKVKLSTRRPTNQEIEDAGMEYSREFTKAVRCGLMPREAMKAILNQNGAWTKKEDAELSEIEDKIVELETADYKNNSDKHKKAMSDAAAMREHLTERRKVLSSYLEHTAEAKAYEAQRDYIVCCVTEYVDSGDRVWPELTFKDEKSGEMIFRSTYEHMTFINDVPSQIESEEDSDNEENVDVEQAVEEPLKEEEKPAEKPKTTRRKKVADAPEAK